MSHNVCKSIALVIGSLSLVLSVGSASAHAETFSVQEGMALNTNNYFSRIDGTPRMSIYQRNDSDNDQQFDKLPGNRGGILLKHRSTGKCLNAHYLTQGSQINVWSCDANDPDQNWNLVDVGSGYNLIKRTGTNLCVDTPTRDNQGKVHLINCDGNNGNQRWKSSNIVNPPPNGQINLPFRSGQTWYVCQGYQGYISHGNYYALDLTISNKDFGSTACWANDGNASKSAGQPLLAPAAGKIYHIDKDLVCLSIDKNRSLLLGHIDRTVSNGANVNKDDVLGYTSRASSVNGGFSHIHLEGRKSSNCAVGTTTPLTDLNSLKLNGVENLPDISGRNDYFKKVLTRP
ncbi:ricin-type beta-trefoil lectin domain protein [Nostoc sp.]|uniref:ricin-type beta-trefoil lectin domain protein n=1 Tax=Nostoc sp. TaxID=1180 RepID=UPI002FFCF496